MDNLASGDGHSVDREIAEPLLAQTMPDSTKDQETIAAEKIVSIEILRSDENIESTCSEKTPDTEQGPTLAPSALIQKEHDTKHGLSTDDSGSVSQTITPDKVSNIDPTVTSPVRETVTINAIRSRDVSETYYCEGEEVDKSEGDGSVSSTSISAESHSATVESLNKRSAATDDNDCVPSKKIRTEEPSRLEGRDLTSMSQISDPQMASLDVTCSNEEENVNRSFGVADFSKQPKFLTGAWTEFKRMPDNFLIGCKWSPDGLCVLTNSADNCLRLFDVPKQIYEGELENVPEMHSVLRCQEGELVYDYEWYPLMDSSDPDTCFFVSTSRSTPVHMWDAHTGKLRSSFRAYDQMDEITPAHSLAFSPNGKRLYCGFNKIIRVFDVQRPGRSFENRPTYMKQGQAGIINCIAVNPANQSVYAAGSFNRTVALYTEPNGHMMCMFEGQQGGVTRLQFSPDGNRLYSGGRKDPEILCWDMRKPGEVLYVMQRNVFTNQRIYFHQDVSGQFIASGNHTGVVSVWNTDNPTITQESGEEFLPPSLLFCAHSDTVNGISINPVLPLMATASGRRHFPDPLPDSASESDGDEDIDFSLKLWWTGKHSVNDT